MAAHAAKVLGTPRVCGPALVRNTVIRQRSVAPRQSRLLIKGGHHDRTFRGWPPPRLICSVGGIPTQSVNLDRHATALRPFSYTEFGIVAATPPERTSMSPSTSSSSGHSGATGCRSGWFRRRPYKRPSGPPMRTSRFFCRGRKPRVTGSSTSSEGIWVSSICSCSELYASVSARGRRSDRRQFTRTSTWASEPPNRCRPCCRSATQTPGSAPTPTEEVRGSPLT